MILRLGCLETDPEASPSTHIWTSHRVLWLDFPADLPCLEEHARMTALADGWTFEEHATNGNSGSMESFTSQA